MTSLPQSTRSRAAAGLDAAARRGRFELQVCANCGTVQYPCRDACVRCLSEALEWRCVPSEGTVLARTVLRSSAEPWFGERLPIAIGLVHLDCGPQLVSFLDAESQAGGRVSLRLELGASDRAALHAAPAPTEPAHPAGRPGDPAAGG